MNALHLTIDFSELVRAVYWMAAAVALFAILTLVRVSIMRAMERSRERSTGRLDAVWIPVLNSSSSAEALPSVPEWYTAAFMAIWNAAHEATYLAPGDPSRKRELLNGIARRCEIPKRARARLHHGDIAERLLAITALGHLRDTEAAVHLRELVESPNTLVSLSAARSLLQIDAQFAEQFVHLMIRRADWPPSRLMTIVREESTLLRATLLDLFGEKNMPAMRRAMPYLRFFRGDDALEVVRAVLKGGFDIALLVSGLKVLAAIGDTGDAPLARALTAHANWRVRVQAANALAQLGSVLDASALEELLSDRHWWVRYRAARALALLLSPSELQALLARAQDRFARDMLRQMAAEVSLTLDGGAV